MNDPKDAIIADLRAQLAKSEQLAALIAEKHDALVAYVNAPLAPSPKPEKTIGYHPPERIDYIKRRLDAGDPPNGNNSL